MENDDSSLYLNEIAQRLWSGHASLMVGAGFSKNASDKFLSWRELGDLLYNKLYHNPKDCDKAYLDILKLADEVESTLGKTALNDLIKKELPDKEYPPSKLHKDLLRLPWKDVFTTNYDTLLERAAETIVDRRYEVVVNKDELNSSNSPRIIKLHGSFPSTTPFILSGEDYRRYPNDNAPFVNTVQQSLLENTLCMIGFSGDDPNFLKWIGWIRDNLGKEKSSRIYLIGALTFSCGEQKLLESRNIIPINLSHSENPNRTKIHAKAIQYFIDKMNEIHNKEDRSKWGDELNIEAQKNSYKKILADWEAERASYPGWLILPVAKREVVFKGMNNISITDKRFSELSTPDNLFFLYEFNWRTERCLHPILNDWVPIYESVLQKYDPFKKAIITSYTKTQETFPLLDWDKIREVWIALQLSLLRLYREEGWTEKWDNLYKMLKDKEPSFSEEHKAKLNYELCLHYLFTFNIEALIPAIRNWKVNNSLPYWAAKRATLLAEFCLTEDAVPILEQCLKEVRRKLNLVPINNDYSLVSLESYLMLLYRTVVLSKKLAHKDFNFKSLPDYKQRWNELKQYQCDPWREIGDFKSQLSAIPLELPNNKETHATFGISRKQTTYSFGEENKSQRLSWEHIRFIEETGIPYHLPFVQTLDKNTLGKALYFVSKSSPLVAITAMVRSGNKENVKYIYDRKTLSEMGSDIINKQASEYIELLRSSCLEDHQNHENIFSTLSLILPEILSRFCTKISFDLRKKLIDILKDIYKSMKLNPSTGYDTLMERLVNSFTKEEQYKLIPKWLEFPITDPDRREFDPFSYISYGRPIKQWKKIVIKKEVIDGLLSALTDDDSKRSIAIYKLSFLEHYHLLNPSQMDRFGKNLWIDTGKDGFPKQNVYLNFAFISLPHPKNISPVDLLRTYIKNTPFDQARGIGTITIDNHSIDITNGDVAILRNIAVTDQDRTKYIWTDEDINALTDNINNWWNKNKHSLVDTREFWGTSISQEFKQRFNTIEQILTGVIAHNFSKINTENVTNLKIMIDELPNYGISNLNIKSALGDHYSINFSELEKEILSALSSSSEDAISDAIRGILILAGKGNDVTKIINTVSDNFRCCKKEGLCYCIKCLKEILWKDYRKYISSDAIQNIELGLVYLKEYTTINESDDDLLVDDKLQYRQHIASLLPRLVEYYESKHQDLPPIVSEWVKIVSNQNEFSDIRNAYINAKEEE
ncbi:MAG: SIR2 family protein [Prevotella sp.]|jgi:hypothetical protein|nr:SIR2 family protein [Prevotella sp.]MCI2124775.1 SIR2 family protein [Prevotella sp.]